MGTKSPLEIVRAILTGPTDPDIGGALVAPDAIHVSPNANTLELKRIMLWTGTGVGPDAIDARVRRGAAASSSHRGEAGADPACLALVGGVRVLACDHAGKDAR